MTPLHDEQPPPPLDEAPPPPSDEEAEHLLSILTPSEAPDLTDVGNAERLARRYGGLVRHVPAWDKWIAWNGTQWAIDNGSAAKLLAMRVGHELEATAREQPAPTPAQRGARIRAAQRAKSSGGISAAVALSEHLPGVAIDHEQLDQQPWLLPCANGVIDLCDGSFSAHDPTLLYTHACPIAFDDNAACPRWERFLDEVFVTPNGDPDRELIDAMQRAVGYSLTGLVAEQCLFFLHGDGSNGKSVFRETLLKIFGSLAAPAPRNFLDLKRGESHATELTVLFGRRLITCAETTQGRAWDESLIKDLTGDDRISARRMRENFWSFAPTHKLWVSGNHKPIIRGTDDGIWRRMALIPFTRQFDGATKDLGLKRDLDAELPGILRWAVDGAIKWNIRGLDWPDTVRKATAAYREEQDLFRSFLNECCVLEEGAWIQVTTMRRAYESWCKENGCEPLGARTLNERIRKAGATDSGRQAGLERYTKGWSGLRLRIGVDA